MSRLFTLKYHGARRFTCHTESLQFDIDPSDLRNADVFFCRANSHGWLTMPDQSTWEKELREIVIEMENDHSGGTTGHKIDSTLLYMELMDGYPLTTIIDRLTSFGRHG